MSARTTYTKIQGKYVQKSYTTASTAAVDTPRSGSYNTLSNIQVTTKNLLLTSDYPKYLVLLPARYHNSPTLH